MRKPIAGISIGLLWLALALAPLQAAAPMVRTQAPGYYRMMLGDFEVTALLDGTVIFPIKDFLNGVTPEQLQSALARDFMSEPIEMSINAFLVNTGSTLNLQGPITGSYNLTKGLGGTLILSGLLRSQTPLVREAYQNRGLLLERAIKKEAWATLVWRKPQRP